MHNSHTQLRKKGKKAISKLTRSHEQAAEQQRHQLSNSSFPSLQCVPVGDMGTSYFCFFNFFISILGIYFICKWLYYCMNDHRSNIISFIYSQNQSGKCMRKKKSKMKQDHKWLNLYFIHRNLLFIALILVFVVVCYFRVMNFIQWIRIRIRIRTLLSI